jgi:hypothetical protein
VHTWDIRKGKGYMRKCDTVPLLYRDRIKNTEYKQRKTREIKD